VLDMILSWVAGFLFFGYKSLRTSALNDTTVDTQQLYKRFWSFHFIQDCSCLCDSGFCLGTIRLLFMLY